MDITKEIMVPDEHEYFKYTIKITSQYFAGKKKNSVLSITYICVCMCVCVCNRDIFILCV